MSREHPFELAKERWKQLGTAHPGLMLDYLLPHSDSTIEWEGYTKKVSPKALVVEKAAESKVSAAYNSYFTRWETQLTNYATQNHITLLQGTATANPHFVVGLGAASVVETSITLHQTFGVPYIPGSALKGLVSSFAHKRLGESWEKAPKTRPDPTKGETHAHIAVFGDLGQAGSVLFFDALPEPNQSDSLLLPDVMTPHHLDYYSGKPVAPADWDDPNPVSFVRARGEYRVVLMGQEQAAVEAAFQILTWALEQEGIGAKTSSGYGRMELREES